MPAQTTKADTTRSEASHEEELAFASSALRAEADAIARTVGLLDARFVLAVDLAYAALGRGGSVIVSGMGKSGLIGQKISATMASIGVDSHFLHPAEALHGDLGRVGPADCVLLLSYSGKTDEAVALASILKQDSVPIVSITRGHGDSPLERLSTVALGIGAVEEACPMSLAPTSSTTATLALGDAFSLAISRRLSFTPDDFAKRHPAGWLGELLRPVTEVLRFVAGSTLPVLPAEGTVAEALTAAAAAEGRRPGAMVFVDGAGALCGLFTDGDLRRLVLRDPSELSRPITEVMTKAPRTLPSTAVVRDALEMVREHRQDEIPVVDGSSRPVGVLDVQDLLALRVAQS